MTNPDNKLGTNAAFSGRTSPNAFNDMLQALTTRGIVSGWEVRPAGGMTLSIGATAGVRDVAVVEDDIGNRLTLNNRTTTPVPVNISEAPEEGSRIDTIIGYVNNPPEVIASIPIVDNPTVCALLTVEGTASESPTAADDKAIREAITADEASGATAYYVVFATVKVEAGQSELTPADITAGEQARTPSSGANYEAGTGLKLAGATFSVDFSKVEPVGTTETYTIQAGDWSEDGNIEPFAQKATVTATHTIGSRTIAELYNDNATLFATYGFSIGSIEGQSVTFYALEAPEDSVILKVNYKETS